MSDLSTAALKAMEAGLAFAQTHLLAGEEAINSEEWHPEDLPLDEKERLLLLLRDDAGLSESELEIHLGEPPIPADRQTHVLMAGVLKSQFPSCYVVGEEATAEEWDAAEGAPPGALIFSLDAIDGSRPYDTLTFGYSTNLLAYRRTEARDELQFAAVANASGFVMCFEAPDEVRVGTFQSQRPVTQPLVDDIRWDTVAVLGARPDHRALAGFLLSDDSLTVFTAGGAPASFGLVIGRLGALVCTKAQTTHDTAYLPILAFLGIPILIRGNVSLSLADVLQYFSRVARGQEDRNARPIPAFVAARNPRLAGDLGASLPREH